MLYCPSWGFISSTEVCCLTAVLSSFGVFLNYSALLFLGVKTVVRVKYDIG